MTGHVQGRARACWGTCRRGIGPKLHAPGACSMISRLLVMMMTLSDGSRRWPSYASPHTAPGRGPPAAGAPEAVAGPAMRRSRGRLGPLDVSGSVEACSSAWPSARCRLKGRRTRSPAVGGSWGQGVQRRCCWCALVLKRGAATCLLTTEGPGQALAARAARAVQHAVRGVHALSNLRAPASTTVHLQPSTGEELLHAWVLLTQHGHARARGSAAQRHCARAPPTLDAAASAPLTGLSATPMMPCRRACRAGTIGCGAQTLCAESGSIAGGRRPSPCFRCVPL